MNETALTPEQILDAAEDALRRFGPAKTNVVDVARELGVSHGSVYRHFPSKAALREAVCARWLARVAEPLETIVGAEGPAAQRLHDWCRALMATKRAKANDDPALFATYHALAVDGRGPIADHVNHLVDQIERIVADGVARGEFTLDDPHAAARAVFDATGRFHKPMHAADWNDPTIDADFDRVWALLIRGLAI